MPPWALYAMKQLRRHEVQKFAFTFNVSKRSLQIRLHGTRILVKSEPAVFRQGGVSFRQDFTSLQTIQSPERNAGNDTVRMCVPQFLQNMSHLGGGGGNESQS